MKQAPPPARSPAPTEALDPRLIDQLQHNWALEMDGVSMYNALAQREKNPERKTIFYKLGEFERRHAEQWARRLEALNALVPAAHDGSGHATRIATTPGGLQAIILAIEGEERRDVADYTRQLREVAVGAAKSLVTVRSWWSSGLEMTVVGAVEGVVTYLIGVGLGHVGV